MIPQSKYSRPTEIRKNLPCDETGFCSFGADGVSRVWERNPRLLDLQTSDRSPKDLGYVLLKEGWYKFVTQLVFYGLERRPYVWGGALHEIPLLLEGLLQACV